jgi:DNA primase
MVYDLDSIKQQNSIADVVAKHGVALRESGGHLLGHCPFHEDEHPSFAVYPETRSFYCFGCNAGGDVIDFVRRADNLSFRDAVGNHIAPRAQASPMDSGSRLQNRP